MKIDIHTHIIPEKIPDFSKKFGYEGFVSMVNQTAKKILLQEGSYNEWGARPIRRVIQNRIESEISIRFLDNRFLDNGGNIVISGKDGSLLFQQKSLKNKPEKSKIKEKTT